MKQFGNIILCIGMVFSYCNANAQQNRFMKHYDFNDYGWGWGIIELNNKYFIAGGTDSLYQTVDSLGVHLYGNNSSLIFKIDSNGDSLSSWRFGDETPFFYNTYGEFADDKFTAICHSGDGNMILLGNTQSYNPSHYYDYDFQLVKMDTAGNVIWNKVSSAIGDTVWASLYNIIRTSDGNYAVGGYTNRPVANWKRGLFVMFDSLGNYLWHKTYSPIPSRHGSVQQIAECNDGGFMLGGSLSDPNGPPDVQPIIIKTDSLGNSQLIKYLPYTINKNYGQTLIRTSDGNYVFGYLTVFHPASASNYMWQYHLMKIDEGENEIWTKDFIYTFNSGFRVYEDISSNLFIAGIFSDTLDFRYKALLIKTDGNGDSLW
ncbi:MAG: hypothetical protein JJE25_01630, partial [Bacteroidia bacterium]|nr:hypothetical protein [Bacteroidia bacterium]